MDFDLARIGAGLPVAESVDAVCAALLAGGAVVVQAPPGTGKTTMIPPAVANLGRGRVVVTQPRRVAARAAARRLAALSGTQLGGCVGYTVRGDSKVSARTRVEFVTTGVLVRRLLRDPELPGVGAVVLDEVHERALDCDLAFAMVRDLREFRPELLVGVMSATLDAGAWAGLLGDAAPAPVVAVAAELHPLEVRWRPASGQRVDARGVTQGFIDHLASTAAHLLEELGGGNVLAFVPGAREADAVAARLRDRGVNASALTGSLGAAQQDEVLADRPGARVIVATAVAESSLTVPGVRGVVDSGPSREPRYDAVRQMGGLVTVSEARSSAEQRAGRAARLGPGVVVRCFAEDDWPRLRPFPTPEILTADLTRAALDLACWGAPGGEGLALPDAPPTESLRQAVVALQGLGALDAAGRATRLGRRMAEVPADPRLARALMTAAPLVGSEVAAEVVAALAGDGRTPGGDLEAWLRQLRQGGSPAAGAWRHEVARLRALVPPAAPGSDTRDHATGLVAAMAFPDRVARRRGGADSGTYLLASGTGAQLERGSALRGQEWLAVTETMRGHTSDGTGALIRAAAPLTREMAELAASQLRREETGATWRDGRVTARRRDLLGAIELSSTPVRATVADARRAVARELARTGLGLDGTGLLRWSDGALALRRRLALLHHVLGEPWPAFDEASLLERVEEWLGPELDQLADGAPASRLDLTGALRRLLPWPAAGRLDELVPERLTVPTGSAIRLVYPDDPADRVVLAVKLQECFGLMETPRIVDGRVPVLLHLLSPAQRPLAVTDDLASFWRNAYPGVRAENRGRYLRHPWPEDPLTAPPRRGTTRSGR